MANSTLLTRNLLNDGYFAQFMIWWWVPAIAAVLCVAALPAVPYARRVGVRGAFASLVHKVSRI